MWYFLYNVGLILAAPVVVLILLAKKRCRRGLPQRLGRLPRTVPQRLGTEPGDPGRVIWVHAVSLGEVTTATPLIRALHDRHPCDRVIVSTATETGREAVERQLPGIATHFYAPLDFPWVVACVVDHLDPAVFVFVETEIWPNLLRTLARRGVPSILINGRISPGSVRRKMRLRPFWRRVLSHVSWLLMQSNSDVERIVSLGASETRVLKTGTLKFDQPIPSEASAEGRFSRETVRLAPHDELLVAGSTHAGDEEQLLKCFRRLSEQFPSLVLILAPRHLERVPEVEAAVRAAGFAVNRRTDLAAARLRSGEPDPALPRVIILDTRGELVYAYREAAVAFVGGTFARIGGHNLLEPALWGTPVFFGLHTDHCAEVARLLVDGGGGIRVEDGAALCREVTNKLRNRESLREMGQAARRIVDDNLGALERTLQVIEQTIGKGNPARGEEQGARGELTFRRYSSPADAWRVLLRLLLFPYELLVRARAALYLRGWLKRKRLPRPVISIGNLTVGGTGKTPMVICLAEWLHTCGKRVAVLSRGYRRRSGDQFLMVSDGQSMLVGPSEAGDEPYLIAQRCPHAVVAVGADRYGLGQWVLEQLPIDCFLLDDGFQHLALERDVDLLLVDASDPDGLRALFPAGRLREPVAAAARATALVLTRIEGLSGWEASVSEVLAAWGRKTLPILVRFRGEKVVDVIENRVEDVDALVGGTAVAFCGIANADSFRNLVRELGVTVVGERIFSDHHDYGPEDIRTVLRLAEDTGAEMLLTTEKDACKVAPLLPRGRRVLAIRLVPEIIAGRDDLEQLVLGRVNGAHVVACA